MKEREKLQDGDRFQEVEAKPIQRVHHPPIDGSQERHPGIPVRIPKGDMPEFLKIRLCILKSGEMFQNDV
jgi:hypothetical protein